MFEESFDAGFYVKGRRPEQAAQEAVNSSPRTMPRSSGRKCFPPPSIKTSSFMSNVNGHQARDSAGTARPTLPRQTSRTSAWSGLPPHYVIL